MVNHMIRSFSKLYFTKHFKVFLPHLHEKEWRSRFMLNFGNCNIYFTCLLLGLSTSLFFIWEIPGVLGSLLYHYTRNLKQNGIYRICTSISWVLGLCGFTCLFFVFTRLFCRRKRSVSWSFLCPIVLSFENLFSAKWGRCMVSFSEWDGLVVSHFFSDLEVVVVRHYPTGFGGRSRYSFFLLIPRL